jgi:hypothetical protein
MIVPKYSYMRLTCFGDSTYTVRARITIKRPDGRTDVKELSATIAAADTLKEVLDTTQIGVGFITDAQIEHTETTTNLRPGQLWARLSIRQGSSEYPIVSGHISNIINRPQLDPPLAHMRNYAIANPAAGASLSYTMPVSLMVDELSAIRWRLAADANAANRVHRIWAKESGGVDLWHQSHQTNQTAGLTYDYSASLQSGANGLAFTGGGIGWVNNILGASNWIPNGGSVGITVYNIQVGDQISGVQLSGKFRWVDEAFN